MSAIGTKRTLPARWTMSAFGGKADIAQTSENVRFWPKADKMRDAWKMLARPGEAAPASVCSPQSLWPHLWWGARASSPTPSRPRNSIRCSSKTRRIVVRFRTCIGGAPSTRSPREIADYETRHWWDNWRTDHFSNARAARICAPLIGGSEVKFPATRRFLDGS